MRIEIEFEEGDWLIINGKRWEVTDVENGLVTLDPVIGEAFAFGKEEIEEMIEYAGTFKFYRKDALTAKPL